MLVPVNGAGPLGQARPNPQCRHVSMRALDGENDCYSSIDAKTDIVAVAWRSQAHECRALHHLASKKVDCHSSMTHRKNGGYRSGLGR